MTWIPNWFFSSFKIGNLFGVKDPDPDPVLAVMLAMSVKPVPLLLFAYKPTLITRRGFYSCEWDFKNSQLFALLDWWSVEKIESCRNCTVNYLGCMAKYSPYTPMFYVDV